MAFLGFLKALFHQQKVTFQQVRISENKEQFGDSLNTQEMEEAAGCELSENVCNVNQVLDYINSLMAEHSDKSDDNSFFLVRIAMKVTRRNVEILLTRHK